MTTRAIDVLLRLIAATALAIDAYAHAADSSFYGAGRGGAVTQATMFLLEAAAASLAATVLIVGCVLPAVHRAAWIFAFLVAATAFGGVVLYTYADIGALGPIPNMYEPTWSVPDKQLSAYAEAIALVTAAAGFTLATVRTGRAVPREMHARYAASR